MLKVLSLLLLIQIQNAQWCLSQDIIRGERDKFMSDVWKNVNGSHECNDDYCTCGDDDKQQNTFIYEDNNLSSGRCVKDEHIVKHTSGCYHFPDDTFMGLVKMNLECLPGTKMKHDCIFNILAPIDTEHLMCELRGNESEYTLNGHEWFTFRSDPKVFSLSRFIPDPTIKIIEIRNRMAKWKGTLLKLKVQCSSKNQSHEERCVLLKIAGSSTIKNPIVPTTSSTTSPPTSSSTSLATSPSTSSSTLSQMSPKFSELPTNNTSNSPTTADNERDSSLDERDDEAPSLIIPVVVPVIVTLVLLLAAIAAVLLYRRRQRSIPKQNDADGGESIPIPRFPDPEEQQELPNMYEDPENITSTTREHDNPYDTIINPRAPKNPNNLIYEYATREEITPNLPEGRRQPADEVTSPSSVPTSAMPTIHLYGAVASGPQNGDPRSNGGVRLGIKEQLGEEAFYHTLENTDEMTKNNEQVYEEANKKGENEPFYNILEEP